MRTKTLSVCVLGLVGLALGAALMESSRRSRRIEERADEVWARVAREIEDRPGIRTFDVRFAEPFADAEALYAWAESPPGERAAVVGSTGRLLPTKELTARFREAFVAGEPDERAVPAATRACIELRRTGSYIHLVVCVEIARTVRAAVHEGRLARSSVAELALVPSLEDVRVAMLGEVASVVEVLQRLVPGADSGSGKPFATLRAEATGDEWQTVLIQLSERAVAAVEADTLDELRARLKEMDAGEDPATVRHMGPSIVEAVSLESEAWRTLLRGE